MTVVKHVIEALQSFALATHVMYRFQSLQRLQRRAWQPCASGVSLLMWTGTGCG